MSHMIRRVNRNKAPLRKIFSTFALYFQAPDSKNGCDRYAEIRPDLLNILAFDQKQKIRLAKIRKLRPKMGRQKLKGALFLLTRLMTHPIDDQKFLRTYSEQSK